MLCSFSIWFSSWSLAYPVSDSRTPMQHWLVVNLNSNQIVVGYSHSVVHCFTRNHCRQGTIIDLRFCIWVPIQLLEHGEVNLVPTQSLHPCGLLFMLECCKVLCTLSKEKGKHHSLKVHPISCIHRRHLLNTMLFLFPALLYVAFKTAFLHTVILNMAA